MSGDHPSAIVVGAGVFGAATADALVARGWQVTVVEQYAPGNARGSSGDRTRLLRLGHADWNEAEDLAYIRSAARGIAGWQGLAEASGLALLERTGLVWFGHEDGGLEDRVAQRMAAAGAPCERVAPEAARALFPSLATDDLAFGLYEPEAYVIRASAAVEALLRRALSGGARLVLDRAQPAGGGAVALEGAGQRLAGDAVVWACGAWLGALFPRSAPVRPSWQDVLHWNNPPEWRGGPAWVDAGADLYGFPDVDGLGIKAVSHAPGRTFDLDHGARLPEPATIEAIARYVERRFPALAATGVLWGRVMPYEMTPDRHFLAGPVGDEAPGGRQWVLGGGSGHGFKHAPALGAYMAELLAGEVSVVPMWSPGPRG